MANRVRGETVVRLGERELTLRLHMRALAEIEDAFDRPFAKVLEQFSAGETRAGDLIKLLDAICRANGHQGLETELWDANPSELADGFSRLIQAGNAGEDKEAAESGDARPPKTTRRRGTDGSPLPTAVSA